MADPILHKVVPEDLLKVAQTVELLINRYGRSRAAFMLDKVALAIRRGKIGDGKGHEIFVQRGL